MPTFSAPVSSAPATSRSSRSAWPDSSNGSGASGPVIIDLREVARVPAARIPHLYGSSTTLSGARALPRTRGALPTVSLADRAQLDAVWERYPRSLSTSPKPSAAAPSVSSASAPSRSLSRARIAARAMPATSAQPARRAPGKSADTASTSTERDWNELRKRYAAAQSADPALGGAVGDASRAAAAAASIGTSIVLSGSGIVIGSGYYPDFASDPVGWCNWWYWNDFYPGFCGYWMGSCGFWFGWGCSPFNWNCNWSSPWYGWGTGGYWYPYYAQAYPPAVVYETVVYEQSGGATVLAADQPPLEGAPEPAPNAEASPTLLRAAAEYLALGDRAFAEGRYGSAVHYYAKAVEFAPDDGVIHLVLSDALFSTGDYHYAASALRQALELAPDLAGAAIDKHQFYGEPEDFERQLALLEAYLQDHFLDDDARLVLAANYLFGGYAAKCVELLEIPFSLEVRESAAGAVLLTAARAVATTVEG